jgi:fluoroquinolone transport system permease protein
LLLDEKDAGTLLAIRVTPFSASRYLRYRMIVPVVGSLIATPVITVMMDLFRPAWLDLLLLSLAGALLAPLIALLLALVATNKVQGFALAKGMGVLVIAPVAFWSRADLLAGQSLLADARWATMAVGLGHRHALSGRRDLLALPAVSGPAWITEAKNYCEVSIPCTTH